jgi:hypothetical protein
MDVPIPYGALHWVIAAAYIIYLPQFSAWLIAQRNKVNKVLLQASEIHDRRRGTLEHCLLNVVK